MSTAPLTITDVRAVELRGVPFGDGLVLPWNRSVHSTRDYLAVRVETAEGLWGLALDGDYSLPTAAAAIDQHVTPRLLGRSALDVERHTRALGAVDAPGRFFFVEIALWDVIGRALGLPLYQLWGGEDDRTVAYASTVHYGKSPDERAEDCLRYRERGYRAVKLRFAEDTVAGDLALVEACRKAVGDDMAILVDANQAGRRPGDPGVWTLERALQTARGMADLGAGWLEEPLPYALVDDGRRLAEQSDVPIAGAEGKRGVPAFWEVLANRVYDIVQPDPVVSGTPGTLLKIGEMVRASGRPVAFHHGKSGVGMLVALHLQAALGQREYLEVMDDPGFWNAQGFQVGFRRPLLPDHDGIIRCPEAPGLGADWDPEWLERNGLA